MKIDYKLLERYLRDSDSNENKYIIAKWFGNISLEKELREKSYQQWKDLPEEADTDNYNEEMVLGNIYRKIKTEEFKNKTHPSKGLIILNYLSRIAAVLFIPLLVLYALNNNNRWSVNDVAYTEVYSPPGARTMFYLPDGTKGWLNSGSSIKFPERFIGNQRQVVLKGEAYFDVVTNPNKPFNVSVNNLNIVAKGTSFNILSWEEDSCTEVVLEEGILEIYKLTNNNNQSLATILNPGQLCKYSHSDSECSLQTVDVEKYISWTSGRLVFKSDPLSEVVQRLNRWYNVNIVIRDDILKSYEYVATFEDETLDEILSMLSISAPIDHNIFKRKQLPDGSFEKKRIELYYSSD
jgi:ferric-dicitrate binding protein FerR (iron transport regulator)